jgi:putative spermidine/putrescine transport system ATP-binding protein
VGDTATDRLAAGVPLRLPAPQDIAAGSPVVLSVRPEQLVLSPVATAESWTIEPGLSLPLGSQLIHVARTVDGAAIKIVEPRRRAPAETQRRFCALAADARPSLFPRSTPSATE